MFRHKQVHVKSSNKGAELPQNIRLLLEEKEQTLLSSQETVQVLTAISHYVTTIKIIFILFILINRFFKLK